MSEMLKKEINSLKEVFNKLIEILNNLVSEMEEIKEKATPATPVE